MSNEENIILNDWHDKDLYLSENILRGIYAYGFEIPSKIQRMSIPHIIKGKNVIAEANSGTGKTGSYLIGVISKIYEALNHLQCIILSPTRELAQQIHDVGKKLAKYTSIRFHLLVGGTDIQRDILDLKKNTPHIVVGSIGRISDIIYREVLDTSLTKILVIDEADEMLSNGFHNSVQNIFNYLHRDVQIILFSATISEYVLTVTKKLMNNPVHIKLTNDDLLTNDFKQYKVICRSDSEKYNVLKNLFNVMYFSQCIIYCNSIIRVSDLYEAMKDDDFPVTYIHSNMCKTERNSRFSSFVFGTYRVLISTNLTSRGIDIQQVSTVINFDLPKTKETYIHRIGRSGRWGKKGVSISFCTMREIQSIKEIENFYDTHISELSADFDEKFKFE